MGIYDVELTNDYSVIFTRIVFVDESNESGMNDDDILEEYFKEKYSRNMAYMDIRYISNTFSEN